MSLTAEQRAEKLARFKKEPPVGRRMPGRMRRRKRDPERVRSVEVESETRGLLASLAAKVGEKFFVNVYRKGPKRVDKTRSRTRSARRPRRLMSRDSRNVNRRLSAGRVLVKLARRATRAWACYEGAE